MQHKRTPTGIRVRHSRSCGTRRDARCDCRPSYEAFVYSRHERTKLRKTFATLSAARAWRHDAASAVRKGTMRAPTKTTLREAWLAWHAAAKRGEILNRHRRPFKPSVLRSYDRDMQLYVVDDYGRYRFGDLRPDDLQALVDRLVGMGLSGSRVRNVLNPLRSLYRRHRREVAVNPTLGLDLPEPGGSREWNGTPEDAKALIDALPRGDQALWATAFYAGLRSGELQALRISCLHGLSDDVGERWVEVAPDGNWDAKEGRVAPKYAASVRWTLMPETLRVLLHGHVERSSRSGDDLVFGSTAETPFTPSSVYRRAYEAWDGAGLSRTQLHLARHAFGSFCDAAGISETRSERYLGHAPKTMSARYRHRLPGQLAEDAEALDSYLNRDGASVVRLATGARTGAHPASIAQASQEEGAS